MKQKALFILGITGIVLAMFFASCNNDPEGSAQGGDDDVQKLINTIADADKAMENVRGSLDGTDISKSGYWVTPEVWDDIVRAKISANAALNAQPRDIEEIKRLYRTLSVALDTFNKDKQPGTGPAQRSVKIDGLDFPDGTTITLELYEDFNGTMPRGVTGSGQIQNKTVTVPLYSTGMVEPPGIWNSSGGWLFAVLRVNTTPSQTHISKDVLRFVIIANDSDSVVPALFSDFKPFVFRYEVRDFNEQAGAVTDAGISMNAWCKNLTGTREYAGLAELGLRLYKDNPRTQEFSGGETLKADTAIYCDFDLMARRWQIGAITGTIALPGTDSALEVFIYAYAEEREQFRSWTTLNDKALINSTNGGWSIPIYKDIGFFPTDGGKADDSDLTNYYGTYFALFVQPTGKSGFFIDIPTVKPAVTTTTGTPPVTTITRGTRGVGTPSETYNVGNLGSVNLNTITLSGTLTVTRNEQPVPYVQIKAFINDLTPFGSSVSYTQPGENAEWSIRLDGPVNPGTMATLVPVNFEVSGYQDSALTTLLFTKKYRDSKDEIFIIEVTGNDDVKDIAITMGNVN